MQIILLSGGSGTRLWPLSNDARSKQFLRLLQKPGHPDERESMVQRVIRQLGESGIDAPVTIATSESQRDSVISQVGDRVDLVTEPSRRDTFPAICLACEYLRHEKGCPGDEVVVVMPCDPYTQAGYFATIAEMARGIARGDAEMIVMGIKPTYPSAKYGYVVPAKDCGKDGVIPVTRFTEKPDVATAEKLITEGALWNGGVFAFRLEYVNRIAGKYVSFPTFDQVRAHYTDYPKISFDYEVAEKARHIGMVPYDGEWKDLGTWNTLTDEIHDRAYGNVTFDDTAENTHAFNELDIPMLCIGTRDLVIAASPDGIIVSEKAKSENVKQYASTLKSRPMYEERRWGDYKVIGTNQFPGGIKSLTKELRIHAGKNISYQTHSHREEFWTFIDGEGLLVLDGVVRRVKRGETVKIDKGVKHAIRAITELTFIEVQLGDCLTEDDIIRFPYEWQAQR